MIGQEALEAYCERFERIRADFREAAASFGLPFADAADGRASAQRAARLRESLARRGTVAANDGKSLSAGGISPACIACRKGVRTASFITSMECPRSCFFCFNPNQPNYEHYRTRPNPLTDDLRQRHEAGAEFDFLAVTGGEPLLHPDSTLEFLKAAKELYPAVHTRLYTSGFGLDDAVLGRLEAAGLDEVRFSVKLDEGEASVGEALGAIGRSVGRIPAVMVEMPVMPDQGEAMDRLLEALDRLGATGMNLLELGFPFHNAQEFSRRGYLLKPDPYRVVYGYGYGGGLPIFGSEEAALGVMDRALAKGLGLQLHYCSLENRLTSQIYALNAPAADGFPLRSLSERDFFLKSAKAFGGARKPVRRILGELGAQDAADSLEGPLGFVEFPLGLVGAVASRLPDAMLGISYGVAQEGGVLQELWVEPLATDDYSDQSF